MLKTKVTVEQIHKEFDEAEGRIIDECNKHITRVPFPFSSNAKYFESKEKAEEYILMAKPCLSINDINAYCNLSLFTLKELVKSKL